MASLHVFQSHGSVMETMNVSMAVMKPMKCVVGICSFYGRPPKEGRQVLLIAHVTADDQNFWFAVEVCRTLVNTNFVHCHSPSLKVLRAQKSTKPPQTTTNHHTPLFESLSALSAKLLEQKGNFVRAEHRLSK